ncbi:UNVERIFIED_CONTAM: hypothetical protein Slati_0249700 [Sesamum latifolium]|uniref:Transmembrane protein n=1 Tax=Sesamum latifolium TaxID=2727402 RepID=A0AAW2YD60_9LAMI
MLSATLTLCSSSSPPLCNFTPLKPSRIFKLRNPVLLFERRPKGVAFSIDDQDKSSDPSVFTARVPGLGTNPKFISTTTAATSGGGGSVSELDDNVRKLLQSLLWIAESVYIIWLFLLPYAPMSEGLFNFVIGWTFMFAPLLYTDRRRDRYKGSLDVLWGFQMFLTNTFLIPYMAIRLNEADGEYTPSKTSQLGSVMKNGAPVVGLIGGLACLISILWALFGRGDGNYGDLPERWEFLLSYLGSERLAYAFIWDICLYIIFQPWLIGDNLQNIQKDKVAVVNYLRFVPVVGLIAYCLCLDADYEK